MTRAQQVLRDGERLASELFRATGYASVPTVDGRVLVYAPRRTQDTTLQTVERRLRTAALAPERRTARVVDVGDDRLAVVEVSGAGR